MYGELFRGILKILEEKINWDLGNKSEQTKFNILSIYFLKTKELSDNHKTIRVKREISYRYKKH